MAATIYPIGPVQFANLAVTATGEVLAAVAGKQLQILAMHIHIESATDATIYLQDDADTPIVLFGTAAAKVNMSHDSSDGPPSVTLPFNERGWFQTSSGKALDAVVAGTTPLFNITIAYTEIG